MSSFASIADKLQSRSLHRRLAWLILLPSLVTITTGIVLLLRQDFEWIQPKARTGTSRELPTLPLAEALLRASAAAAPELKSGATLSSIDVRPSKGTFAFRYSDGLEVQLDGRDGTVLHKGRRRTAFLIELHQGTWFHSDFMKWVFLPSGVGLLLLWVTGVRMAFGHWLNRVRARGRQPGGI
jgi:hypothetical protein